MNHTELIDALSEKSSLPKTQVKSVLDALADVAQQQVKAGNDVYLNGLGRLRVVKTSARTGRNPRTGEALNIPAKNRVTFVSSKALKDAAEGK